MFKLTNPSFTQTCTSDDDVYRVPKYELCTIHGTEKTINAVLLRCVLCGIHATANIEKTQVQFHAKAKIVKRLLEIISPTTFTVEEMTMQAFKSFYRKNFMCGNH